MHAVSQLLILHALCLVCPPHTVPGRKVGVVSFTDQNAAALGISLYKDYDGWGSPGLHLSLRQPSYGGGGGSKRPFTPGKQAKARS